MKLGAGPLQVTPPDAFGHVSLGVSVDIVAAAIEPARLVIAEVNPARPWTLGDATVHASQIDAFVDVPADLPGYRHPSADDAVVPRVARCIAGSIEDGSTRQIGMGRIPQEALRYLDDRRDLDIHSDVITDAVLPLLEKGILTGARTPQLLEGEGVSVARADVHHVITEYGIADLFGKSLDERVRGPDRTGAPQVQAVAAGLPIGATQTDAAPWSVQASAARRCLGGGLPPICARRVPTPLVCRHRFAHPRMTTPRPCPAPA